MKKLLSLTFVLVAGFASIAQDTIPSMPNSTQQGNRNRQKNNGINRPNGNLGRDTIPGSGNWRNDTATNSRKDTMPGTGNWRNDTMNRGNNTNPNNNWRSDTLNQGSNAGTWRTDTANNSATMGSVDTSSSMNSGNNTTGTQNGGMGKNTDSSATAGNSNAADTLVSDRIVMKEGSVWVMKNGAKEMLDKDYTLPSGAIVATDGSVKYPSGKTVQLKEGQFIGLNTDTEKISKKKMKLGNTKKKKNPDS